MIEQDFGRSWSIYECQSALVLVNLSISISGVTTQRAIPFDSLYMIASNENFYGGLVEFLYTRKSSKRRESKFFTLYFLNYTGAL